MYLARFIYAKITARGSLNKNFKNLFSKMLYEMITHVRSSIYICLQVHDLEFAQIEVAVVQGLKSGNESLKKLHQVCF